MGVVCFGDFLSVCNLQSMRLIRYRTTQLSSNGTRSERDGNGRLRELERFFSIDFPSVGIQIHLGFSHFDAYKLNTGDQRRFGLKRESSSHINPNWGRWRKE